MDERFDVGILGGGPAGAATAISLARRGLRVVLCEKALTSVPRFGEMLPPLAGTFLQQLGVWDEFVKQRHMVSPGTVVSWGSDELIDRDFLFSPYGCGWHLDRARFDELLLSQAEKTGVRVLRGAGMAELQERRARFLVDATGRSSLIARNYQTRRMTAERLTAFGCVYPCAETKDRRLLVEAVEDGWWYSLLLPGNRFLAVYLTKLGEARRNAVAIEKWWEARLECTQHIRLRVGGLHGALRVNSAGSSCLERVATRCWLAVGDAASTYDPLSAQGISKALAGGVRAAEAIAAFFVGCDNLRLLHDYEQWVFQQYAEYLQMRRHFYNAETRWADSPFWTVCR